jgi:Phosphotransferase enzyme family
MKEVGDHVEQPEGPEPDGRAGSSHIVLRGGVASPGAVVREGDEVLRPQRPSTEAVHRLLRHVRTQGFLGAPEPRGIAQGIEHLAYISGDVPQVPFPAWWKNDAALSSTARLLRRFHDASEGFGGLGDAEWSAELADPGGVEVLCHNDVCPENVVYRAGHAIALLDFDFAAPGRRVYDLAMLAKMCCPLDAPDGAALLGLGDVDPLARLRVVADSYGLPADRRALVDAIDDAVAVGDEFVERHVRAGERGFLAMWEANGGRSRMERRKLWLGRSRQRMLDVLN